MHEQHAGSCLCGQVRFEVHGRFDRFFLCHCSYCRKDSGSAHGANLFSTNATLHWLSGEASVTHFQLPASRHARSFCSTCGSALPYLAVNAALLIVPAGSLDSRLSQRPNAHLFNASRADWDAALETLPVFETFQF